MKKKVVAFICRSNKKPKTIDLAICSGSKKTDLPIWGRSQKIVHKFATIEKNEQPVWGRSKTMPILFFETFEKNHLAIWGKSKRWKKSRRFYL